ncbi:DUF5610 domain-containing protein [Simplicispira lacusdiani]|uniref:DUF5610 domain-containing protein n=1 Tax=Simplicispira lacusdiani TaxID=2213010 RepID=UPI0013006E9D|nr:DUF5610 domain-containing protein [Simplicispira lacusdiani]
MAPSSVGTLPPTAALPAQEASQTHRTAPPGEARAAKAQGDERSLRQQQNVQILQASMDVSIQSGDSSLALLYRTAIDRINEILGPELGPNAIGSASNQDNSPEGTAGRILALSTALYDAYAARHPDKDTETLARDFVALIRGGFETGFNEAKGILDGLGVLGDGSPVASGIQKTYELVMKGYDDFLASKLAPPADEGEAAEKDGTAPAPASA